MSNSTIQWTDVTDNIIVAAQGGWWCRMISEGCTNCYAAKLNQSSYFGGNHLPYTGQPPELKLRVDIIDSWSRQTKPKKHFVASMTDVFGDWVSWDWALVFLRGMWRAPKQTFQVLTKRTDIARDYIDRWLKYDGLTEVPGHMWIGTSVENQKRADERIPELLKIPAKVRFLSVEPLLGPVHLGHATPCGYYCEQPTHTSDGRHIDHQFYVPGIRGGIDWVIVGGESGKVARPCNVEWIRSIVSQCRDAGVKCFVKQFGSEPRSLPTYCGDGSGMKLKHRKGGDPAEWPEDLRVREFPILCHKT